MQFASKSCLKLELPKLVRGMINMSSILLGKPHTKQAELEKLVPQPNNEGTMKENTISRLSLLLCKEYNIED